jgi:hypothetical protein
MDRPVRTGLDWGGRDGTGRNWLGKAEAWVDRIVNPGLKPRRRQNKEKARHWWLHRQTVDRGGRGNKSAISTRSSWAGQTSAKPLEGNSGDHAGIKLSMVGLSLCGDSRRASIHLRDEGEPVPVTQVAARPHQPPEQDRTGGLARLTRVVCLPVCAGVRLVCADKLVWVPIPCGSTLTRRIICVSPAFPIRGKRRPMEQRYLPTNRPTNRQQ